MRGTKMIEHLHATNQMPTWRLTMAHLHVAQIAHLSQQLIEQIKNANNLMCRGKAEIDLIHRTVKSLFTVLDDWTTEKELDTEQK